MGGRPSCPHSNSRDVSGVVAYPEVLLEVHGLVGGAELEERRDTKGEGGQTLPIIAGVDGETAPSSEREA